ncbi:MAG: translation elongation factor Ts [Lachnospiraceae bacterium]|nr:translation elongation factor Ts [Lachnospiraceae bacterium]
MAAITASMVKELRELTGAGMMECKKALTETDGNMEEAVTFLKKSGAVKAEKKASRIAAEGICRVALGDTTACVVEVNSETDFVAKNETFQEFVQSVANQALVSNAADVEALLGENGLKDTLIEKTATIGEKLSIRRFAKVSGECVVSYIHGGGRIGVLVAANGAGNSDAIKEALTNVAMQVAAMNPQYVSRNDISADELAKIKEITIDSALNDAATLPKPILQKLLDKAMAGVWSAEDVAAFEEHKSNMNFVWNFVSDAAKAQLGELAMADKESIVGEKMFAGLVDGRVSKQLKEICLLDQTYVKAEDGKQTVGQYLASVSKELVIAQMVRYEVGEGMEKKNENFAEEVAKQMQG